VFSEWCIVWFCLSFDSLRFKREHALPLGMLRRERLHPVNGEVETICDESVRMTSTLDAPVGACTSWGKSGWDSLAVRPICPWRKSLCRFPKRRKATRAASQFVVWMFALGFDGGRDNIRIAGERIYHTVGLAIAPPLPWVLLFWLRWQWPPLAEPFRSGCHARGNSARRESPG